VKKILLFLICIPSILLCQIDTNYIKKYPNTLTVKPYFDYKINQFVLEDNVTGGIANYGTSQVPRIGIGASYKWMSFLASITPLVELDRERKGATQQMDIQWNVYLKAFSVDIHFQQYQGYFLENSTDIVNWNLEENSYYKREDLLTTSVGANIRYNFNHKIFSQKAVFSQTEKQLKSAGTFSAGIRWNVLSIQADSLFAPSKLEKEFINFDLDNGTFYDQGFGFGYSYSFVHKNWFANLSMMPFLLHQVFTFVTPDNTTHTLKSLQLIVQWRGAIGYNSHQNYCGITFVSDQMRSRWKDAHDIGYNFANIKLFYARRFKIQKRKKKKKREKTKKPKE
jgi:hypothetical protein